MEAYLQSQPPHPKKGPSQSLHPPYHAGSSALAGLLDLASSNVVQIWLPCESKQKLPRGSLCSLIYIPLAKGQGCQSRWQPVKLSTHALSTRTVFSCLGTNQHSFL